MLKLYLRNYCPKLSLITVQDNTMLKLYALFDFSEVSLITVQDNTMLKQKV